MKLAGKFALSGFGIMVVITCAAFGILYAQNGFHGSVGDLNWLLDASIFCGLLGAGIGVVSASIVLALRRFFPHPAALAVPPAAADNTVWPPPPVIPLRKEQPSEDAAPE